MQISQKKIYAFNKSYERKVEPKNDTDACSVIIV